MTAHPALVLNADFRPLSYFPLSLLDWQEAARLVFQDKIMVVAEYDHVVRSPSREMRLPSVVALRAYEAVALADEQLHDSPGFGDPASLGRTGAGRRPLGHHEGYHGAPDLEEAPQRGSVSYNRPSHPAGTAVTRPEQ